MRLDEGPAVDLGASAIATSLAVFAGGLLLNTEKKDRDDEKNEWAEQKEQEQALSAMAALRVKVHE